MTNFVLLRPYFLWLLLPFVLLLLTLLIKGKGSDAWKAICDQHLYQFLSKEQENNRVFFPKIIVTICGLLMIFALTGPSWEKKTTKAFTKNNAMIIALDLSNGMTAQDLKPSRIERVKYKLQDLLSMTKETETGLLAFSNEAFVVSPLTTDSNTLKLFLPELHPSIMPAQGHDISAALTMAKDLFKNAGKQQGQILLITTAKADNQALKLASQLKQQGYLINVLGIGTKYGAPILNKAHESIISKLDKSSLTQLARAGGGSYQTISVNDSDIKSLLSRHQKADASYQASDNLLTTRKDNGHWLLFLIVPLFLSCFRRNFVRGLLS